MAETMEWTGRTVEAALDAAASDLGCAPASLEYTVLEQPSRGFFGLFGFTGKKTTGMFEGILDMESGYIKTNEKMETNVPGVYAAGDVRVTPLRQVVTACADGAIAAMQCGKYINTLK